MHTRHTIPNKKADNIIVINNQSTDGTGEWLATQPVTTITQENKGGAWGFLQV